MINFGPELLQKSAALVCIHILNIHCIDQHKYTTGMEMKTSCIKFEIYQFLGSIFTSLKFDLHVHVYINIYGTYEIKDLTLHGL